MIVVAPGVVLDVCRPRTGGFPRHSHDEYVISTNLVGRETVRLDAMTFEVGTREVTVYNPGQVQSGTTVTPPGTAWACASLYVSAQTAAAWGGGVQPEAQRPVVIDPQVRARLLSAVGVVSACSRTGTGVASAGSAAVERALLAESSEALFGWVMAAAGARTAAAPKAPERPSASWVAQVRDRLTADPMTPVDLGGLAAELGRSREHIIRTFTAAHGCPPYAWQLELRLARARAELARGVPVAEVAQAAGFADQAHLSKHFLAAYAVTPGRWRTTHLR